MARTLRRTPASSTAMAATLSSVAVCINARNMDRTLAGRSAMADKHLEKQTFSLQTGLLITCTLRAVHSQRGKLNPSELLDPRVTAQRV